MARELTKKEIEQLKEFQKDIRKHTKRINKMGFYIYVTPDMINIMDGPTHQNDEFATDLQENIVYTIDLNNWTCGDW